MNSEKNRDGVQALEEALGTRTRWGEKTGARSRRIVDSADDAMIYGHVDVTRTPKGHHTLPKRYYSDDDIAKIKAHCKAHIPAEPMLNYIRGNCTFTEAEGTIERRFAEREAKSVAAAKRNTRIVDGCVALGLYAACEAYKYFTSDEFKAKLEEERSNS